MSPRGEGETFIFALRIQPQAATCPCPTCTQLPHSKNSDARLLSRLFHVFIGCWQRIPKGEEQQLPPPGQRVSVRGVLRRDPEGGAVTGHQQTHSGSRVRSCGRRWFLSLIKSQKGHQQLIMNFLSGPQILEEPLSGWQENESLGIFLIGVPCTSSTPLPPLHNQVGPGTGVSPWRLGWQQQVSPAGDSAPALRLCSVAHVCECHMADYPRL